MVTANKGIFVFNEEMSTVDGDTVLSVKKIKHNIKNKTVECVYLTIKWKVDPKVEDDNDTYTKAVQGIGSVTIGTGKKSMNVCSRDDKQTMNKRTVCDTDNRVDPDVSGKRTKTQNTNSRLHGSFPIPPTPITFLIQQGGNKTRPMETVKSIDEWEEDSMFVRSYSLDDVFLQFHSRHHKLLMVIVLLWYKEKYHGMEWLMTTRICLLVIDNQIQMIRSILSMKRSKHPLWIQ